MDQGQPSRVNEETFYGGGTGSSFGNLQPTSGVQCARPTSDGVQTCQRLRMRILRSGRTRTFAPALAQHNIPIDELFSFTLHCAIQNTWSLPAAFWFRCKQQVLPHVGSSEAVGKRRRYTDFQLSPTQPVARRSKEAPVSPGEVATTASLRQQRRVGVPRNRPRHRHHHLTRLPHVSTTS